MADTVHLGDATNTSTGQISHKQRETMIKTMIAAHDKTLARDGEVDAARKMLELFDCVRRSDTRDRGKRRSDAQGDTPITTKKKKKRKKTTSTTADAQPVAAAASTDGDSDSDSDDNDRPMTKEMAHDRAAKAARATKKKAARIAEEEADADIALGGNGFDGNGFDVEDYDDAPPSSKQPRHERSAAATGGCCSDDHRCSTDYCCCFDDHR
jgi:hypothetical protein